MNLSQVWIGVAPGGVSLATSAYLAVLVSLVTIALLALLVRVPWRYNLRNLVVRWRTTAMTTFAFLLVVGLLTVMLAFVNGMYRLAGNSGRPENVMLVSAGTNDEVFSNLAFTDVGDVETQAGIAHDAQGRALCSKETYLIVTQPLANPTAGGPQRRFLQLRGIEVPEISAQVHQVQLYPGGAWFSETGIQTVAAQGAAGRPLIEAVLGDGVARVLGRDRTPTELAQARNRARLEPGDTFRVGDREWLVVGVMQSAGLTFDSEIWARRDLLGRMFGKENYTTLVLRTADAATAQQLRTFFAEKFQKAALEALVETEYFSNLASTNLMFLVAVLVVAIFMAIGGVFGVMNTMFAAISQRSKDIGVMRLLGFSRRQILISFLLESLVIALVGGALGCGLGYLANGWSATSMVGSHGGGGKSIVLQLVVDFQIVSWGLLLALGMGLLGGLLPALLAMRLKPLESLR